MKFRNYCLVIMGDTKNILPEVIKIAETKPNILDVTGMVVLTFSSILEPRELSDYFYLHGRNFLVFDLNPENSGYYFKKQDINEALFSFINLMDNESLQQKTDDLLQELTSTTVTNETKLDKKSDSKNQGVSVNDIDKMSSDERNQLMNTLIEKGVNKALTDNDKKLLKKLTA